MTASAHVLSRIKHKVGTGTSFETVASVDMTSGTLYETRADQTPEMTLTEDMLPDDYVQQRVHGSPLARRGLRRWTLRFRHKLVSHGLTLDATTLYALTPLGALLRVGLGGFNYHASTGAGSAAASGVSTTGATVADGSRLTAPRGFMVNPNSLGYYEARWIKSRSSNALTWPVALSQALIANDVLYGAAGFYPATLTERMHFLVMKGDAAAQYKLCNGMLTSLAITVERGTLATLDMTWSGFGWDETSGVTFAGASYSSDASPVATKDSEFIVTPTSGTTRTLVHATRVSYTINLARAEWPTTAGVEGAVDWVAVGGRPVASGSFSVPLDASRSAPYDHTYRTGMEAYTTYQIQHQLGTALGTTILLAFPTVQITSVQNADVGGGINGYVVGWKADTNAVRTAAATPSTEAEDAPFYIYQC